MQVSTLQKKKVLEYLKSNKIDVLTWPVRSPDLNITENVWHLMEEVVYGDKQYSDRKELIRALERCAKKFNEETIMDLNESIPGRLLKIIDVKGAQIQLWSHLLVIFYLSHVCDYLVVSKVLDMAKFMGH